MYSGKIQLTTQDILDKEFKIDANGYRRPEVDEFLDIVMSDYNNYNAEIKSLRKELSLLNDENTKLKNELRHLRANIEAAEGSANGNTVNNVDLLRRISQLEKIVCGKDE